MFKTAYNSVNHDSEVGDSCYLETMEEGVCLDDEDCPLENLSKIDRKRNTCSRGFATCCPEDKPRILPDLTGISGESNFF
jgi:hypothetical protein